MYPPRAYQEKDFQKAQVTMQKFPLATFITVAEGEPLLTHLPMMYAVTESGYGKLIAHIDLHNPQAKKLDGQQATAIFHGPNAYISPLTYGSENQLPTWNYIKVHVKGSLKVYNDPEIIRKSMISMNDYLEANWGKGFELHPENKKMEAYLPFVVGFELLIEEWEGKFKLSKDKTEKDTALALEKMANDHSEDLLPYLKQML